MAAPRIAAATPDPPRICDDRIEVLPVVEVTDPGPIYSRYSSRHPPEYVKLDISGDVSGNIGYHLHKRDISINRKSETRKDRAIMKCSYRELKNGTNSNGFQWGAGVLTVFLSLSISMMVLLTTPIAPAAAPGGGEVDAPVDPIDYVDPMIGSGGLGYEMANLQPGPQAPFGMLRLGPDTSLLGVPPLFERPGGYYHLDQYIRGFSHTHLQGTGAEDYGNILFMPVTEISDEKVVESGYSSSFSHDTEIAAPGYYAVTLEDPGVRAELTATAHAGFHRYTFEPGDDMFILVNASHSLTIDGCVNSYVEIDSAGSRVNGWIHNKGALSGRFGGYTLYFAAQFEKQPESFGVWSDGIIEPGITSKEGNAIGGWLGFGKATGESLQARVGISYISIEQAILNLETEIREWDFDLIRQETEDLWREEFDNATVYGGTAADRQIFYTALYHLKVMPTDFTETGGLYVGFDGEVHQAEDFTYYSDMSLWDTFRSFHPLLALIDPERQLDMVKSLVKMYEQGGDIPRWPLAMGYTGSMIGTSADIVIAGSYLKGINGFDAELAYEGLRLHATEPRPNAGRDGIEYYMSMGYCPSDLVGAGPSKTLEYAYNDWALAGLAWSLGYVEDSEMFLERSLNYQNHWYGLRNFMRGRNEDGSWHFPFFPLYVFDEDYIEGDAWQWLWFVPHDVPGLIDLFGSTSGFLDKLEKFFYMASIMPDTPLPDNYYWHGNEPDIHAVYMFNYAGRPDLTQKYVHWIMDTKYGTGPDGLDGNDDGGTLLAWYIFSSLGFFPLAGSEYYLVGSPRFRAARIRTGGNDLIMVAPDASAENIYVQAAYLNGERLEKPCFSHDQVAAGGMLRFVMGPEPSLDAFSAFPEIRKPLRAMENSR